MSESKHTPGPWTWWYDEGTANKLPQAGVDTADRAAGIAMVLSENVELPEHEIGNRVRADARLIAAAPDLLAALIEIRDLAPRPFEGFPKDWHEQIAACAECQSYKGHPIQQGICDTHRQPLWARESHEKAERAAVGARASIIARDAIAKAVLTPPGVTA